jgi:rod shape-determining protein MreC
VPFLQRWWNKKTTVFVALQLTAFLILASQIRLDQQFTLLDRLFSYAYTPVLTLVNQGASYAQFVFSNRRLVSDLNRENERLKHELASLKLLVVQQTQQVRENLQLRALLELPKHPEWHYITAEIIGRHRRFGDDVWIINKGEKHGLRPDLGVIGREGVLGVVFQTHPYSAKIKSLPNPGTVVACMDLKSKYMDGFIEGRGSLTSCFLKNIPTYEPFQLGDTIVTSGMDRLFPQGLPIGILERLEGSDGLFQTGTVRFSADFSRQDQVFVLLQQSVSEMVP